MIVLYPGHRYELRNLKSDGLQRLQFRQDPPLHPPVDGTSCQEVLRALIDRVQVLHEEKPWHGNALILADLRHAISLFESRALELKVQKGRLDIEKLPTGDDGHLIWKEEE